MEICYNVQEVIYLPFIKNKNENTIDYSTVIRITIAILWQRGGICVVYWCIGRQGLGEGLCTVLLVVSHLNHGYIRTLTVHDNQNGWLYYALFSLLENKKYLHVDDPQEPLNEQELVPINCCTCTHISACPSISQSTCEKGPPSGKTHSFCHNLLWN